MLSARETAKPSVRDGQVPMQVSYDASQLNRHSLRLFLHVISHSIISCLYVFPFSSVTDGDVLPAFCVVCEKYDGGRNVGVEEICPAAPELRRIFVCPCVCCLF